MSLTPERENGGAEGIRTLASRLCRPQRYLFATAPTARAVEQEKGPGSVSLTGLGSSCGVVLSSVLQRQNVSTHSAADAGGFPDTTTRAAERTNHLECCSGITRGASTKLDLVPSTCTSRATTITAEHAEHAETLDAAPQSGGARRAFRRTSEHPNVGTSARRPVAKSSLRTLRAPRCTSSRLVQAGLKADAGRPEGLHYNRELSASRYFSAPPVLSKTTESRV
jgi:hypothetical protein